MPLAARITVSFCVLAFAIAAKAQLQSAGTDDSLRVTLSVNEDGSRTAYEFDQANRKAVATTTSPAGKLLGKIRYQLDDAGRFATGEVFGPDEKFRFKTIYKYDASGKMLEETRLTKEDAVMLKLVYSYDALGKQTGYSVYDASGKLVGQTTPKSRPPAQPAKTKAR